MLTLDQINRLNPWWTDADWSPLSDVLAVTTIGVAKQAERKPDVKAAEKPEPS